MQLEKIDELPKEGVLADAHRGIKFIEPTVVSRPVGLRDLWRVFKVSTRIKIAMAQPWPGRYPNVAAISHCQIEPNDPLRFFVVDKWGNEPLKWYFGGFKFLRWVIGGYRTIINPVIIDHGDAQLVSKEGCFSYPGAKIVKIKRYEVITMRYWTFLGPRTRKFYLQRAIICQHETDHFDLVSIVDRHKRRYS